MSSVAFKIVNKHVWYSQFNTFGRFSGTDADQLKGFIHLSTFEQLGSVIQRKFNGSNLDLLLACVDLEKVATCSEIRWEKARDQQRYPHLYGFLLWDDIKWTYDMDTRSLQ